MTSQYKDIPTATVVNTEDTKNVAYGTIFDDEVTMTRGQAQPPAFRDPYFAIVFWLQFGTVAALTVLYATGVIEVDLEDSGSHRLLRGDNKDAEAVQGTIITLAWVLLVTIVVAPLFTVWSFSYMYQNAISLIQTSIYMAVGINIILAVLFLWQGLYWAFLVPALGAIFTALYAKYVWNRIPYAAAILKTAIASIQSQIGVAFLGLASIPFYVVWWVMWIYVFTMSLNTPFMLSQSQSTNIVRHDSDGEYSTTLEQEYTGMWWFLCFLLFLSFYWTNQVIGSVVNATVAGAVGTFWFVPEEAIGCCSTGLSESLFRATTYSFGSLCFGSLIVAVIQAVRAILRSISESRDGNGDGAGELLRCLAQCILSCLESMAEYFNKWAFIYVGLYGYPYLEAGKNVMSLFRERGWTTVISDDLTSRVLGMVAFAIGLGTAIVAGVVAAIGSTHSEGATAVIIGSILLAWILGMMLASIVFGVVNSASDTVIVLFAEAPRELEENHPALAAGISSAWRSEWPEVQRPAAPTALV